jgi:hypothetical protein
VVEQGGQGVGKIGGRTINPTRCGGVKVSEQRDSDKLSDEVVQGIEELHGSARGIYLLAIKLARAQLRSVDGLLADLQTAIERQAENEVRKSREA